MSDNVEVPQDSAEASDCATWRKMAWVVMAAMAICPFEKLGLSAIVPLVIGVTLAVGMRKELRLPWILAMGLLLLRTCLAGCPGVNVGLPGFLELAAVGAMMFACCRTKLAWGNGPRYAFWFVMLTTAFRGAFGCHATFPAHAPVSLLVANLLLVSAAGCAEFLIVRRELVQEGQVPAGFKVVARRVLADWFPARAAEDNARHWLGMRLLVGASLGLMVLKVLAGFPLGVLSLLVGVLMVVALVVLAIGFNMMSDTCRWASSLGFLGSLLALCGVIVFLFEGAMMPLLYLALAVLPALFLVGAFWFVRDRLAKGVMPVVGAMLAEFLVLPAQGCDMSNEVEEIYHILSVATLIILSASVIVVLADWISPRAGRFSGVIAAKAGWMAPKVRRSAGVIAELATPIVSRGKDPGGRSDKLMVPILKVCFVAFLLMGFLGVLVDCCLIFDLKEGFREFSKAIGKSADLENGALLGFVRAFVFMGGGHLLCVYLVAVLLSCWQRLKFSVPPSRAFSVFDRPLVSPLLRNLGYFGIVVFLVVLVGALACSERYYHAHFEKFLENFLSTLSMGAMDEMRGLLEQGLSLKEKTAHIILLLVGMGYLFAFTEVMRLVSYIQAFSSALVTRYPDPSAEEPPKEVDPVGEPGAA